MEMFVSIRIYIGVEAKIRLALAFSQESKWKLQRHEREDELKISNLQVCLQLFQALAPRRNS